MARSHRVVRALSGAYSPNRKRRRWSKNVLSDAAQRSARREFQPKVRAARKSLSGAKKAFRQEKRSLYGASNILTNALDQQIAGLDNSGLKGRYKQQVAKELQAAKVDAGRYPATMIPEARATFQADKAEARTGVLTAKAELASETAQDYESLMGKSLTEAKAKQKAARTKKTGETPKQEQRAEVKAAMRHANNLLRQTPVGKLPWAEASIKRFGSVDDAWRVFEEDIRLGSTPADIAAARAAVAAIRRKLDRQGGGQRFVGARASGSVGR